MFEYLFGGFTRGDWFACIALLGVILLFIFLFAPVSKFKPVSRKDLDKLNYDVATLRNEVACLGVEVSSNKSSLDTYTALFNSEISAIQELVKDATQVHSDIHMKHGASTIIVCGRYRNHDYVRMFQVDSKDNFKYLVDILRDMEKYCGRGYHDFPDRGFSFEEVLDRENSWKETLRSQGHDI